VVIVIFDVIESLPSPAKMKDILPAKMLNSEEIADIIQGKSDRFLLIVGPCSANDPAAVLEYAHLLSEVAKSIADKITVVMRVYTAKPRSATQGYMGLVHEKGGLFAARKLHIDVLTQTRLPTADEMLYPALLPYFDDVVSYFAVGARSVENQEHKLAASAMTAPVGIKNPLSGCLKTLETAVLAARTPHKFIHSNAFIQSAGNPLAHGILRGGTAPNYNQAHMLNIPLIIDASHGNSNKNPEVQVDVAMNTLDMRKKNPHIKGLMLESFIKGGRGNEFGMSVTDPCLSWKKTHKLIFEIYENLCKCL